MIILQGTSKLNSYFFILHICSSRPQLLLKYRCLTKEGALDWVRIRQTVADYGRSEEERIEAVRLSELDKDLPTPRIWNPIYGEFFFRRINIHNSLV